MKLHQNSSDSFIDLSFPVESGSVSVSISHSTLFNSSGSSATSSGSFPRHDGGTSHSGHLGILIHCIKQVFPNVDTSVIQYLENLHICIPHYPFYQKVLGIVKLMVMDTSLLKFYFFHLKSQILSLARGCQLFSFCHMCTLFIF